MLATVLMAPILVVALYFMALLLCVFDLLSLDFAGGIMIAATFPMSWGAGAGVRLAHGQSLGVLGAGMAGLIFLLTASMCGFLCVGFGESPGGWRYIFSVEKVPEICLFLLAASGGFYIGHGTGNRLASKPMDEWSSAENALFRLYDERFH